MISKSATNKKNCSLKISFTNSARSAFLHIIKTCLTYGAKKIILPGYIGFTDREGSGVFDPVEASKAQFSFYKVNDDLSVNLEDFRKKIQEGAQIALVIHYFGFCRSDMRAIQSLCADNNVILIEDCAHAFYLESDPMLLGGYGDFAFYSLHKYLPLATGGLLATVSERFVVHDVPDACKATPDVIEQYALSEFEEIKRVRRKNYEAYFSRLAGNSNLNVMYELGEGEIPQSFAIRVKNGRREKLYFYLMDKGFPTTALYYRMIDALDAQSFPISFQISSEILNLPVHQDTEYDEIGLLCDEINRFFEGDK